MKKNLTVIDIGTNTVCAVVAKHLKKNATDRKIKILGLGYQATNGLEYGAIIDINEVENSIMGAISTTSNMAQKRIRSIIVALPPWAVHSQIIEVSKTLDQTPVNSSILHSMMTDCAVDGEVIIHTIPINYSIDDNPHIKDPLGMVGDKLYAIFHVISVKQVLINNINNCFNKNNIEVLAFVSSAIMSAMAFAQTNESSVMVIDFGGSCTAISCVDKGVVVYSEHIPIGSDSITHDIAVVLKTSLSEAERLKILYGLESSEISNSNSDGKILITNIDGFGEKSIQSVSCDALYMIIATRVDEILDLVKKHILENNIDEDFYQHIVITGGGSQLNGLSEYIRAKNFLIGSEVTIGQSVGIVSDDSYATSASFSAIAGTLMHGINNAIVSRKNTILQQIKMWVKGNI